MKIERKTVIRVLIMMLVLIVSGNLVVLAILPLAEFTAAILLSNAVFSLLIGGAMAIGISVISSWLDSKHPWLRNPLKRLFLQISLTLGISFSVILIAMAVIMLLNQEYSFSAFAFMIKVAMIFLSLSLLITYSITFFINWKKSVVMQEQMKREHLALQYETLKSQVNPHFLFNSLNAVTSLISTDPAKAIVFVKKLSEVFRYILEQKDNEIITLETELQFLDSYIFLQKIRFGENLTVNIDVSDRSSNIIPLSLQMLIENAIKHNVISKEYPLTISISTKNTSYLAVTNNLQKKPALDSNNLGLANIKSRYEFFTSIPVIVTESEKEFSVEIPLIERSYKLNT
jgi:LytS/YehU family sensor histidine kinase